MSPTDLETQQQELEEKEDVLADIFAEYLERYETDAEATSIDIRYLPEIFKDMGLYEYYYSAGLSGVARKERQRALREIVSLLDREDQGRIDFMAFCEVMPMVLEQAHSVGSNGNGNGDNGNGSNLRDTTGQFISGKKRKRDYLQKDEIEESFYLFTNGEDRAIELKDLRRVAEEIGDGNVTDDDLRDMLRLHAVDEGGGGGGGGGEEEEEEEGEGGNGGVGNGRNGRNDQKLQVSKEDFLKIMQECDM
ncbi:uncharacterized protein SAPINGB_P004859 [Magnusiomyces paraingens]|uniref:EF-hand domain-containing protein n=1 Tax=Magnusiomyces paraingens TaxID=2606893 RepID=A0A5E8C321_9ASCO|nr:uncharacterized protein SAPINGB_P004859 [Saprochaete ingens]VVT56148.1 unnamed protein product [Saprochaete ingens]